MQVGIKIRKQWLGTVAVKLNKFQGKVDIGYLYIYKIVVGEVLLEAG